MLPSSKSPGKGASQQPGCSANFEKEEGLKRMAQLEASVGQQASQVHTARDDHAKGGNLDLVVPSVALFFRRHLSSKLKRSLCFV